MESLPSQILLDIFHRLGSKSFLSLSLVSKRMRELSRPLLFRDQSTGCLRRLNIFSQQLRTYPLLASKVISVDISCIHEGDFRELQPLLQTILQHTPNLRHLKAPRSALSAKLFNNLLKKNNYLIRLQSFECSAFPQDSSTSLELWSPIFSLPQLLSLRLGGCGGSDLDLCGDRYLLLRCVDIKYSCLGYTIIARLIQSCQRLESIRYASPSSYIAADSDPATITQALLSHKNSLTNLRFDFCSRAEDQGFGQTSKLQSLEEFSCLRRLCIPQDCLPWCPLLPSSLEFLSILCYENFPDPDLFHNIGTASHSSLGLLRELYVQTWIDGSASIFKGFHPRIFTSIDEYEQW
ncbi:hypothetical protein BJX63DRAFT_442167 [Aspergillus granulosus]|uniref:F-box domain-containing protein n=1 Tax=Aspergillus granulosus TaxID=176169 RepID=A0ABR4GRA2_9EURO